MIKRSFFFFLLAGALAWLATAQPAAEPLVLALLTETHGDVKIVTRNGERMTAYEFQAIAAGQRLELATGASVAYVCRNGAFRRSEVSFEMGLEVCPPEAGATTRRVDDIVLYFGSLELVGEARGDRRGFGHKPVLLLPRCPEEVGLELGCHRRLTVPTVVRWAAVTGAGLYHLELTDGRERVVRATVEASNATCSPRERIEGHSICSLAWPETGWSLEPGELYRLEVVAVLDPDDRDPPNRGSADRAAEWSRSGRTIIETSSGARARTLEGLLDRFEEPAARAAVYLGAGFFQEAAGELESLEKTFGRDLELGEIYLRLDLPSLAEQAFARARAMAQDEAQRRLASRALEEL